MKRTSITALVLLALAATAHADRKAEEIAVIASAVADVVTTEIWLNNGRYFHDGRMKTPIEHNPLGTSSLGSRIALKSAGAASVIILARLLERDGHDKTASAIRLSASVAWFGVAGWNASLSIRF